MSPALAEITGAGREWTVLMISELSIPCRYLQGIDSSEIVHTVHSRPAPVIPATAGLGSMF